MLWSEFCLGGYFRHAVCYVIIEALILSKRQIKKVYLSQVLYFSKIISGIQTYFEQVNDIHLAPMNASFSSAAKWSVGRLFLEKYIFLFPFSSIFLNFIINDSIFGIVLIHNDSSGRIIPLLFVLA